MKASALAALLIGGMLLPVPPRDHAALSPSFYLQEAPGSPEVTGMMPLLGRAKEYCVRLSKASFDFVCLEEVAETIWERRVVHPGLTRFPEVRDDKTEHKFLYDYQFIAKDGRRSEKRIMLERDGVKARLDDAPLETSSFFYENVLFGPVDLLDDSRQLLYSYHLEARESQGGEKVWVIDAVPVPGLAENVNHGRIWLRERDAAILKISWGGGSMKQTSVVEETARRLKSTPEITMTTEFGFEKNGVRFPSRFTIEESYVNKKGKRYIKSILTTIFRDYKFFTVSIE